MQKRIIALVAQHNDKEWEPIFDGLFARGRRFDAVVFVNATEEEVSSLLVCMPMPHEARWLGGISSSLDPGAVPTLID